MTDNLVSVDSYGRIMIDLGRLMTDHDPDRLLLRSCCESAAFRAELLQTMVDHVVDGQSAGGHWLPQDELIAARKKLLGGQSKAVARLVADLERLLARAEHRARTWMEACYGLVRQWESLDVATTHRLGHPPHTPAPGRSMTAEEAAQWIRDQTGEPFPTDEGA